MSPAASLLRIALVSLHTSPGDEPGSGDAGGMNVVVRQQAEAMAAAGHTVDILTRRSSPTLPDAVVLAPRLTLRFLQAGPVAPISKGAHEAVIDEFRVRLAALGDYDVIHSHHWFSGMAALPLAQGRGIPHVQSFHSIAADPSTPLSAGERPESPGRMRGEAWLARESDALVAISNAEADTIVTRLGGSPERIFVVLPGVDADLFHPAPGIRATGPGYAIVAARLQPLKGLDLAVEAIAAVPTVLRPELIIAGDASGDFDGYIDGLRELADRNGVADNVRFLGPQTRTALAALFRDAKVVLIPSHSETFGLVALEAAASGVPVVASASGGLREAVLDGDTGIVLASRDPQAWGAAITTLLGDADLARRLSVDARARAERLDWPRSARALLDVYRGLLEPCSADEADGADAYDDRHRLRIA
ncbi:MULTISPECIES: glycosyltransferase [unclassified Cryobacterium]|uniref:glycosyltransferase n=1 Tax=unclassified Cryobacterium TaxID=2649013 RepID=UPI002AB32D5D|nr:MULTISPECIES: glycosyltransferase [unclassified Cryobacterium]MDY7542907.1 glycosyltransferase [Cryobacterium sp. 5B3]MEA9999254.1 glycosyltransferase [Cryobacterium sp. RTS3]MEB0265366.1 glycosyltransferase [Cryobacterium sp. 10I5]MEB0275737.1 glycosyltransferase [Cryobacterium sp. 5B3]